MPNDMRDRLIELLKIPIHPRVDADPAEVVADYLLDNGVILPPCKVNDVVYTIIKDTVAEHRVQKIEVHINGSISFCFSWHGCGYEHKFVKDIGKTVFLTKEDAEKALKERESDG